MMSGLGIQKGFISILAIGYLTIISVICGIQMEILENRMEFYSMIEVMDKRIYFEVLIMERIKDCYEQGLVDDCDVYYEGIEANIDFEDDVVIVKYTYDFDVYERKYIYNSEFGFLEIIAL